MINMEVNNNKHSINQILITQDNLTIIFLIFMDFMIIFLFQMQKIYFKIFLAEQIHFKILWINKTIFFPIIFLIVKKNKVIKRKINKMIFFMDLENLGDLVILVILEILVIFKIFMKIKKKIIIKKTIIKNKKIIKMQVESKNLFQHSKTQQ